MKSWPLKLVEVHGTGDVDKLFQTFYIFIYLNILSAKLKLSPIVKHCAFNLGQKEGEQEQK